MVEAAPRSTVLMRLSAKNSGGVSSKEPELWFKTPAVPKADKHSANILRNPEMTVVGFSCPSRKNVLHALFCPTRMVTDGPELWRPERALLTSAK